MTVLPAANQVLPNWMENIKSSRVLKIDITSVTDWCTQKQICWQTINSCFLFWLLHFLAIMHKNSCCMILVLITKIQQPKKNCLSSADMFLFIPTTDVMFIFRTQKTSSLLLFLLAAK